MGSLDRRIQQLEELYHSTTAEERAASERSREELRRKTWSDTLNAIGHIRRAPIDEEEWRFEVENLRHLEAFSIACYIAALADLGHPDEQRAREILEQAIAERGLEAAPLWEMVEGLVATMQQMNEEIEKRGA